MWFTTSSSIHPWIKVSAGFALKKGRKNLARRSNRKTKILVSVPDDRYAVSNGSGYAVLICWVNTLNWTDDWIRWIKAMVWKSVGYGVSKCWIRRIGDFLEHGYAVSSLMDTAYWSSE
ncbi:hypothetical protein Tco_0357178 [Tanacetum coccineum]